MVREREYNGLPGIPMLVLLVLVGAGLIWWLALMIQARNPLGIVGVSVALLFAATLLFGLFMVNPNEARVLQLFGGYVATVKIPGLRWANPFYTKKRVSQRIRNFESARLKVNDTDGNPIEIAAVIVWKVVDTAEALFLSLIHI